LVNRRAVISNQLGRMDYYVHKGLLCPAKGPLWWKLGPPGKSEVGICPPLTPPNDASEKDRSSYQFADSLVTICKFSRYTFPLSIFY